MNAPPRAGRREWIGLAVLALPCLLYSMDLTVLNLAVPQLSADLRPTSSQLLWIVDIYGFLVAASLIPMGTLGDRIGRRRLLLVGAAAFGIASALTAFSRSAAMLIAGRALLGLAAATLAPSTLSLIRSMFADPTQRTTAIAVWVASFSAGAAIGPVLGGLLLQRFWWGSVFLLPVPVMLLLVVVGPLLLPEFRDPEPRPLDLISAALSLFTTLSVIYGLKHMAQEGVGWMALGFILSGVTAGFVFIRRQQTVPNPLIDPRLFGNHTFTAALAINTIDFFIGFGIMLFMTQYLQLVLGLSPAQAGLWMVPWACAIIVGSMLTPLFVRIVRPAYVMAAGLVIAAIGFGVLTRLGGFPALPTLVTASVLFSFGLAPMTTLATDITMGAVPPERAGAASAMSETSSEFGGALGIAVLGALGTAVYRGQLGAAASLSVSVDTATVAQGTLGGAMAVAGLLPDGSGRALMIAARHSFTRSFEVTAAVSAALAIATAVIAIVLLRHVD
jgi:DHA2 family multidrug resistance protein-like MFS transporter